MTKRILIVGWPGSGKTTLGKQLSSQFGIGHLCTDPCRLCPHGVVGTPDHLAWSECSQFVCDCWIGRSNTVIEGVAIPRALRKWRNSHKNSPPPCERVIWLMTQYKDLNAGQIAMGKSHDKVLAELLPWLKPVLCIQDTKSSLDLAHGRPEMLLERPKDLSD